jgi:hypothetical protein
MKNLFITLALVFASNSVFSCKLETPIDLRGLEFRKGHEIFTRTDSAPDIRTLMSKDSARFFSLPSVFHLTQVEDSAANRRDGTLKPVVLGARIALGDTVHAFGMSDMYEGFKMERTIEKIPGGEIHTVKASSLSDSDGWRNYFLDDLSVIKILNDQVVSIELTEGFWTKNPSTNKYDYSIKKTCVTEAAR